MPADVGATDSVQLLLAGPVVVSAVSGWQQPVVDDDQQPHSTERQSWVFTCEAQIETVAVGALEIREYALQVGIRKENSADLASHEIVLAVGSTWMYPLRPGFKVLHDGKSLLLPTRSGADAFVVALPSTSLEMDFSSLLAAIETAGCLLSANGSIPSNVEGATFLGFEKDSCSAQEIFVGNATVQKGASACVDISLDDKGYFYWRGSGTRKERTRPRWRETNCVICRRASEGRRISWECFHVPQLGEIPGAAKLFLQVAKAEAAAASTALWASRREKAGRFTAASLKAVAAASPYVAGGIRLAGQGAAATLEFGGGLARATMSPADTEPLQVDPEIRDLISTTRGASEAGVVVCQQLKTSLESGASMVGGRIASTLPARSEKVRDAGAEASTQLLSQDVVHQLGVAGSAAASGIGTILDEIRQAKTLLRQHGAEATCAVVGARYGSEAEATLGDAMAVVGSACDLSTGVKGLSRRQVAQTAAVHCTLGCITKSGEATSSTFNPAINTLDVHAEAATANSDVVSGTVACTSDALIDETDTENTEVASTAVTSTGTEHAASASVA